MSEEHRSGDIRFLLGLFIGGLIGAAIIFFMGTKEGKKTSGLLEEKGKDLLDDLKDKKDELTQVTTEKIDSVLAHIEQLQENSRETTAQLRKKLFKNLPKKR